MNFAQPGQRQTHARCSVRSGLGAGRSSTCHCCTSSRSVCTGNSPSAIEWLRLADEYSPPPSAPDVTGFRCASPAWTGLGSGGPGRHGWLATASTSRRHLMLRLLRQRVKCPSASSSGLPADRCSASGVSGQFHQCAFTAGDLHRGNRRADPVGRPASDGWYRMAFPGSAQPVPESDQSGSSAFVRKPSKVESRCKCRTARRGGVYTAQAGPRWRTEDGHEILQAGCKVECLVRCATPSSRQPPLLRERAVPDL